VNGRIYQVCVAREAEVDSAIIHLQNPVAVVPRAPGRGLKKKYSTLSRSSPQKEFNYPSSPFFPTREDEEGLLGWEVRLGRTRISRVRRDDNPSEQPENRANRIVGAQEGRGRKSERERKTGKDGGRVGGRHRGNLTPEAS